MSKLSEYSKFDHLVDSDSEDEQQPPLSRASSSTITTSPQQTPSTMAQTSTMSAQPQHVPAPLSSTPPITRFIRHPTISTRFILQHAGRSIYEWEQSLDAIVIYIPTPPGIQSAHELRCEIKPHRLQVGLRRNTNANNNKDPQQQQWFLDEATGGTVDVASSTWTWELPGLLTVDLQKANKGVVWETACQGQQQHPNQQRQPVVVKLDPAQLEEERQRCMLERWQEENPGMDFRNANFNGSAPDPRTFMGGIRYD